MSRWPHLVDWRASAYVAKHPSRDSVIMLDVEHVVEEFTHTAFSLSVSAVWDWDIQVERVGLSHRAAVQAWRLAEADLGRTERFSLEQLVWEGWDLPAVWIRCGGNPADGGPAMPHAFLGGVPVPAVLDPEVEEVGLAWLVRARQPETHPAYQRVWWVSDPNLGNIGGPLTAARRTGRDPGLDRLDAILADRARQVQDGTSVRSPP